ncbi:MAG: SURF1 family protein [Alphaproteobacteria bacterium]|nr:SURF1 family protein [Alphaproteobacteria bacterium]
MFRPLPGLTVATLIALAILIALGTWQLQRRAEKHALLDQIADRLQAAPAPVEILLATGAYAAHRAATAQGVFDHTAEAYVYAPRSTDGPPRPGFRIVTPLRLVSGGLLLVDRGWVDAALKAPDTRKKGQVEGEIEVAGTLRPSSLPATFTPAPDLASRTFYQRDGAAIAKALNLTLSSTLILEASSRQEGGPEPLPTLVNIPDNHLQYALTWFSLALVLLVVYWRMHVIRGRFGSNH